MSMSFSTHPPTQYSGTLIIATHSFWNVKSIGSGPSIIKESTQKYLSSTRPESVGHAIGLAPLDTMSEDDLKEWFLNVVLNNLLND
ncbi:hypothetical protein BT96DRAFT_681982 [Gymnopus androsaceus JB14]|uniref:Uncharacterized protein n=1 Tax=Gymnopus androsaceus JB14 TaxID=1447944 RepID=A0A6A4GFB1_9AGAR|nr:hypothetical protein BT96DRAFT_681982 [Gymnopus androsaceus JB14]